MTARKKSRTKSQETTLRHLWLAGLGVASMARREAIGAANDAAHKMETLKQQAGQLASQAQAGVVHTLASVRQQGEARIGQFSADVEMRLAPVLAKLGLKPQSTAKPRARKPAAAKRTRTTAARKPAARNSVAKRAVRKNRV
ncbi:hypothetical protein [Pseudoxanthomonas sp. UTMC 1351]|uniref:hypothetical protein n=1 Tax=Pseudoxanthomonas sp. UTMC 1351 TaxID=2695853 RepID=UPI0034CF47D1